MSWKVAHACVRGSSHVRSGLPNQDAAQCTVIPGHGSTPVIAVAAISDGHGGSRHFRSQIGSSLAVSTAVEVVYEFLSQHGAVAGAHSIDTDRIQDLQRALVDRWLVAISSDLESNPLSEDELAHLEETDGADSRTSVATSPVLAYGATLLVAAATDSGLLYLQLGDGEILSVSPAGATERPLPADERLLGNQTTSLCQPDAWHEFRAAWVSGPELPALVLLSTDGYSNSFRSDDDFLKIGGDYLEIIRDQGISILAEELPEILKEATQQGSGDDITLAILQGELRRSLPEENGAPVKPRISSESRSALIEQLKARHSSHHRRLDELSTRLDETRKDNRRLQLLIGLLILAVLGAGAYFFRDRLFHSSWLPDPGFKPQGASPHGKPSVQSPEPAAPKPSKDAEFNAWKLELDGGKILTLKGGMDVQRGEIVANTKDERKDEPFARIAMEKGKMRLINDSPDVWSVTSSSGKKYSVKNGGNLTLGAGPDLITFGKDPKGKITGISDPPPAVPAVSYPPPAELNQ